MEELQTSLAGFFQKLGLNSLYSFYWLQKHWPEIVGCDIAAQSKPMRYQRGTLIIGVKSSVWSHHLSMMKQALINKINEALQQDYVKELHFQAQTFAQEIVNEEEKEVPLAVILRKIKVTEAEKEAVWQEVRQVQDEALRTKLYQIILKQKVYEKYRISQGYHPCLDCQILCPPEKQYCFSCEQQHEEDKKNRLRELMNEAPWYRYDEIAAILPCTPDEVQEIRQELIQRLFEKGESLSLIEKTSLAMLLTRKSPAQLTQEDIEGTLQYVRRKKNVSTSWRRSGRSPE